MDRRSATCCFTGHRDIPRDQVGGIIIRTETIIRKLIVTSGVQYFGVGGALGFDTLAAQILFRLRETDFPQMKVILVYPFEGFTSRWTDEQKDTYAWMLCQYDKCVCMASVPSKGAYLARNRHLVDESSHCIAYCIRDAGGTAYTIRYAVNRGDVRIHHVAADGGLLPGGRR